MNIDKEKNIKEIEIIKKNNQNNFDQIMNFISKKTIDSIYEKMKQGLVSPNSVSFDGKNVLFFCSTMKDFKRFIDLGVKTDHRDNTGKNLAFSYSHIPYVNKLIQNGKIPIDIVDIKGRNALFYCSSIYYEAMIEKGIDINHKDYENNNALFYTDSKKTEKLLTLGIDYKIYNSKGMHPLFGSNLNKTNVFLKLSLDIEKIINPINGNNALFYTDSESVIDELIEKGIDPHYKNYKNETALFYMVGYNVFLYMIKRYKLDVNIVNNKKETVLFRKMSEKAKLLLENGIDTTVKNNKDLPALFYIKDIETLFVYMNYGISILDFVNKKGKDFIKKISKNEDNFKIIMNKFTQEENEIIKNENINNLKEENKKKRL